VGWTMGTRRRRAEEALGLRAEDRRAGTP